MMEAWLKWFKKVKQDWIPVGCGGRLAVSRGGGGGGGVLDPTQRADPPDHVTRDACWEEADRL